MLKIETLIEQAQIERQTLNRDERVMLYLSGGDVSLTDTELQYAERVFLANKTQSRNITVARTTKELQKLGYNLRECYYYINEANRLFGEFQIQSKQVKRNILYDHLMKLHQEALYKAEIQEQLEEFKIALQYRTYALNLLVQAARIQDLYKVEKTLNDITLPPVPIPIFTDTWDATEITPHEETN